VKKLSLLKMMICFSFFFSAQAYAIGSSASFRLTGTVPVVLRASIERTNDLSYTVREISNNRDGYVVKMETDAVSAKYNGENIQVVEGEAVLTKVASQDQSVDTFKKLVFKSKPSYVRILVQVM
jgi:hypothetical protein